MEVWMEYGRFFSMIWNERFSVWNGRKFEVWNMEKSPSISFPDCDR